MGTGYFDDLYTQYGVKKPGAPVQPTPYTPQQQRVATPTPAPVQRGPVQSAPMPTPAPNGSGSSLTAKLPRLPGSLSGYDRYERGPGGVGWMDIQTGRPVTDKKLLAVLNGQDPSTVGSGGPTVVVMPPNTPVDPEAGYVAVTKDGSMVYQPKLKMYFTRDKTGKLTPIDPKDVQAAGGFLVPGGPTPLGAEQQEAETIRKGQQARAQAITDRDKGVLEAQDKAMAPFLQRRVLLQDALQMLEEGLQTGPIQDLTANLRSAAKEMLGVEFGGNVDDQIVFRSIGNRLATQMRDAGSGAMSDKDLAVFKSSVPSLQFNPEANKRMIKSMLWGMQHMEKVQQAKYEYWQANGSLKGWDKEMKKQGLDQLYQRITVDPKLTGADKAQAIATATAALPEGTLYINPDGKLRERGAKDEFWADDKTSNPDWAK